MKKNRYYLIAIFILSAGFSSFAQGISLKIANKYFANMQYIEAIEVYEQILKNHRDNREVKIKLAECYRKVKDSKNAIRLYSDLAHEDKPSPQIIWYYAQSLATNGEYSEAAFWYDKYSEMTPNDPNGKKFADAMRNIKQFYQDSAKYKIHFATSINSWQSEFGASYFKNGLVFVSNREPDYAIKHVSEYDESAFLDWYMALDTTTLYTEMNKGAVLYTVNTDKDDHSMNTYATSNDTRTPAHYNKNFLYDSVRYHYTRLTKVIEMGNRNQKFHEGPATATIHGDTVVMTRNTEYTMGIGGKKVSQQALFITPLNDETIGTPVLLPFNGPGFSSGHPAFTPDNKKLYFISNRPGGKGGTDIYVVDYDHGHWGKPVNVEELNTKGDEMFPYVDAAGDLYFSSDGYPGLGGLDIFKVKITDGKLGDVKNLGAPFNSSKDDFSITWDKYLRKGFLSSNRKRGFADDDIYGFEQLCQGVTVFAYDSITSLPMDSVMIVSGEMEAMTDENGRATFCMNPGERSFSGTKERYEDQSVTSNKRQVQMPLRPVHFELAGVVRSEEDKQPMEGVNIRLLDEDGVTLQELVTDKTGAYTFPLAINSRYKLVAARKSCGTNSTDISTMGLKKSKVLNGDVTLICLGDIIRVENIYYDLNKYAIRADAQPELNKLADLMWKYPDMRIELRSHTDSRSSAAFNMKLSANRAQAAVDYLTTKGIIPSRMRAAGYGESLPVNKCKDGVKCSEEEYQQNRRTEFKVLSIK